MQFSEKTLTYLDCEDTFVFTAGEQEMLTIRGRDEQPSRCPLCYRRSGQRPLRREARQTS